MRKKQLENDIPNILNFHFLLLSFYICGKTAILNFFRDGGGTITTVELGQVNFLTLKDCLVRNVQYTF